MVSRVLEKTGATERAKEMMYKAMVKIFLLYGIKSWVCVGGVSKYYCYKSCG